LSFAKKRQPTVVVKPSKPVYPVKPNKPFKPIKKPKKPIKYKFDTEDDQWTSYTSDVFY
jgi:hypothetical protein